MIWLLTISGIAYLMVLVWLLIGIRSRIPLAVTEGPPQISFSIVIVFRNEAKRIGPLLKSLAKLDYPRQLMEVIFVDDDSDDNGADLIRSELRNLDPDLQFRIIDNQRSSGSPKKDAITLAIEESVMDWIACTDADCILAEAWLSNLDKHIRVHDPICLSGPVSLKANYKLQEQVQLFELLGLQQFARAGFGWKRPILSNGANLAYKKQAFRDVSGFKGNDQLASGDDQFLVEKFFHVNASRCQMIDHPSHMVRTFAETSWGAVIQQRVRWASKQLGNGPRTSRSIGLLLLGINLMLIFGFAWAVIGVFSWKAWFAYYFFKTLIDGSILLISYPIARRDLHLWMLPMMILIYPVILLIVAISSLSGQYQWRGRSFDKQP
ncbi:glycosyltransferase [Aureitalea marina]|uniref:Glycosyltransferase 2-like domain-containing protein n=1 Tax=Aureitalea marina TaxID=930804 RepID=A0A2S7KLG3_9FLAO|nr:glycosyltransferase [Aureitalea marina]PQB03466.1 hypothetical protein BST85_00080 [Aureitalea marina]